MVEAEPLEARPQPDANDESDLRRVPEATLLARHRRDVRSMAKAESREAGENPLRILRIQKPTLWLFLAWIFMSGFAYGLKLSFDRSVEQFRRDLNSLAEEIPSR
jgi:hypothetical protein